jgi:hypothetical protein
MTPVSADPCNDVSGDCRRDVPHTMGGRHKAETIVVDVRVAMDLSEASAPHYIFGRVLACLVLHTSAIRAFSGTRVCVRTR